MILKVVLCFKCLKYIYSEQNNLKVIYIQGICNGPTVVCDKIIITKI